jgi:hypothetical protein
MTWQRSHKHRGSGQQLSLLALFFAFGLVLASSFAQAQPTRITIHVKAKGSKFIGSSMSGARVVIREAMTGKILAQGKTEGGTGDTERIMKTALRSTQPLSTEGTARYNATIDLDDPTLVEVEAYGPLSQLQSALSASATKWVIPGKDITGGDAFLLVLHGMVVDILAPAAGSGFQSGSPVNIEANVLMSCGCPLAPGGLWDSKAIEIRAVISKGGQEAAEIELGYADRLSRFQGQARLKETGSYEVLVYAYDPRNGNTGLDRATFTLAK